MEQQHNANGTCRTVARVGTAVKIKGVARQWEGGGYYRIRRPIEELGRNGHEISCEIARSDVEADNADVVVGQLIGGHAATKVNVPSETYVTVLVHAWWRDLYRHSALVYELDDDPFEIEPDNPAYSVYANPIAHDSIKHCVEIANLVTVSTDVLAERMEKYSKNIVVLKNHIDESMLKMQRPQRDRLTIGWAGGGSHVKDMQSCAYGLKQIMRWHKEIDVHFVGADLRYCVNAPRPIRHTPWCLDTTEYFGKIDFDIGLAPLIPTVFAETKSHIKALEYAALGIPVIATDSAPYRDFVIDGVTGFLVSRDHEWAHRLRDLINDEAMRLEMGAKSRELASHWTIQKGYKEWESAYQGIVR
jgi:glycosyltransferase involved in cell wall biosynthesis